MLESSECASITELAAPKKMAHLTAASLCSPLALSLGHSRRHAAIKSQRESFAAVISGEGRLGRRRRQL
jgi:hypothetical protein